MRISRQTWKWCGVIAALAIALWLLRGLPARGFDWTAFAGSIAKAHWGWVALSLAPVAATYYGRALRWGVFMRPLGRRRSTPALVRATVIGFAAIAVFGRPGEFVRPYLIATKERVPLASQLAICILERVVDLLMAFALFGFALRRARSLGAHAGPQVAWALDAGGGIAMWTSLALLAGLLCFRPASDWLRRGLRAVPPLAKLEGWVASFAEGMEAIRAPGPLLLVAAYSAAVWLSIAAFFACLLRALDATAALGGAADVLALTGFLSFGAAVQIPGVGGGIQVVAMVVLTQLFGVRLEAAASFAALVWALSTLTVIPVGLALAAQEGLSWRRLRAAAKQPS